MKFCFLRKAGLLTLVMGMMVAVCACGSSAAQSTSQKDTEVTSTTTAAEDANDQASTEAGDDSKADSDRDGEVPSFVIDTVDYTVTQDGESATIRYEYEYDENWLATKRTLIGGNYTSELTYEYDDQGREVRQSTSTKEKVTTYDEQGNVASEVTSEVDGAVIQTVEYTYDDHNNMLSQLTYGSDGSVTKSYTYTYDDEDRVLSYDFTSADEDDEEQHWEYGYTDDGYSICKSEDGYLEYYDYDDVILAYATLDDDGAPETYAYYTYDEDGNITEVETTDGSVVSYTYTFDDAGNKLSCIRHATSSLYGNEGTVDYCEDFTYNDQGKVLTYRYYAIEEGEEYDQYSYEYDYDDYGNQTYIKYTEGTEITEWAYTYIYY